MNKYLKIKFFISLMWDSLLLALPNEFSKLRVRNFNKKGCKIHPNTAIASNVRITGVFEMKEGSSIAQNCTMSGENAGIFIGKNVMIAPNVVIVAFNHGISNIDAPMVSQPNVEGKIIIEDNVWISSNTTIAKGVTIGTGAIIGANSFVNKDVLPYTIVGGVPAKFIKSRL
ncbi:acyltransferase [Kaistella sp. BT6-1-3]|uniref:Acyltransferase n=1 Tax=Kaistella yananensis TaxID=2989820 RepID=A0ABT3JJ68_9FLAO|nr:acyltransferase [Kaistella yananensis]MCW4450818.1 acyltransferase [Kaistella yananensis]